MMDVILARGRRGWPFFFLWVDIDMRAGDGICMDKCGFVMAHSNFSAATALGKPATRATISHGRSLFLDVRAAPPIASPLCCFKRRGGCGVDPMYNEAWLTVDRKI